MKFSFEYFLIFTKIKLLLSENGKYPKGISWNRFVHISFLHGLFFFRPCTETRPLTETELPAVRVSIYIGSTHSAGSPNTHLASSSKQRA